jgi:hypothetical protein
VRERGRSRVYSHWVLPTSHNEKKTETKPCMKQSNSNGLGSASE